MKRIMIICVLSLIFSDHALHAKRPLKLSLIVPCSPKHAHYLYPLLKLYERQTVLPDEVVISLSEVHLVSPSIIRELKNEHWSFPLLLLTSQNKQYAGTNRNIACEKATGDVFICQDADDLPHPQRIEIIKYFFENYDIDHLMHNFTTEDQLNTFPLLIEHAIRFNYSKSLYFAWKRNPKIQNGCPAIRKRVFQKIQWPDTAHQEDTKFNSKVYQRFKHCIVIDAPLYVYRIELSSWSNNTNNTQDDHWQLLYDQFYNR